jgi:NAD/NADP transhydrogenase alpha subunit
MKIGIPKEVYPGEKRVATTPEVAAQIIKLGFSVCVETGAGLAANIPDDAYTMGRFGYYHESPRPYPAPQLKH